MNIQTTKATATRKKAAIKASEALQKAVDAVYAYARACVDCEDGSAIRAADDGRILLCQNMTEYAGWLDSVYNK